MTDDEKIRVMDLATIEPEPATAPLAELTLDDLEEHEALLAFMLAQAGADPAIEENLKKTRAEIARRRTDEE